MAPGPCPRSSVRAVVLFTTVPVSLPSIHRALGMADCVGVADEGEGEVHLVDDEPPWVDAVRQDQAGGHFPGVYKGHTEVSKDSSEKPVHLESEPVTAIHGLEGC